MNLRELNFKLKPRPSKLTSDRNLMNASLEVVRTTEGWPSLLQNRPIGWFVSLRPL